MTVTCAPLTVTSPVVTSMVSSALLSLIFLMTMLPVPLVTTLSKVSTRLLVITTPVELSKGFRVAMTGADSVVKLQVVVSAMPA